MKITIEDKEYPESLKQIKNPPKRLYLKGNIKLLKTPGIAIVGARNCTQYGENMAKKFAKELAEFGITIISGMALGIDSYAHISTLEANGNTIAVIPSGHSNIYPKENQKLYNQILENNGLIITEYQENEKATSNKFLERNRIVSGLALGTLVVEGGKRSGTSVTARLTREQEKLVFCIPSSLENPKGITPNNLIKEGAILVTSVNDIIENYKYLKLKKTKTTKKKITNTNIKEEYMEIYKLIPTNGSIHINEIIKKSNIAIQDISYKLMMLELEEKIEALPGQNYRKRV